jgi:hypothetical protein
LQLSLLTEFSYFQVSLGQIAIGNLIVYFKNTLMKLFLFVFLAMSFASAKGQVTKFPLLADGERPLWKEYEKATNVKVENANTFSFDLMGEHFRISAYPNGVKTYRDVASKHTKNDKDKDSVIRTKIFLVPTTWNEQEVVIVQVSYIYEEGTTTLKEFWMVPLGLRRSLADAKREYKLSQ